MTNGAILCLMGVLFLVFGYMGVPVSFALIAGVLVATRVRPAFAALPKAKITKISIYEPPNLNSLFNQSNMVVLVETDANITGIGEGGSRDTIEPCGGRQIYYRPDGALTNW